MMILLRLLLVSAAIAYAGVALFMFLQQRSLQYFPTNKNLTPAGVGLQGVAEETIVTPDGERIVGWFAEAQPQRPTILFFHGNGGEVGDRAERLSYYAHEGFGVLFVSYRGYGKSTGTISETGFVTDALAAYDWLANKGIGPGQIVVVGESLGTGVGVQLAAQRKIAALALEAPYTSAADVAAPLYWWLPVRLLMKDTFHSRDFIKANRAPLLIQHGGADSVIPVEQGRRLFDMANEPKELVILPGVGHEVLHQQHVWEREAAFFARTVELARASQ